MYASFLALLVSANPMLQSPAKEVVDSFCHELKDKYVIVQRADEAIELLNRRLAEGKFSGLHRSELAKALTSTANEVCHDAHLEVAYVQDAVPPDGPRRRDPNARKEIEDLIRTNNAHVVSVSVLNGNLGYLAIKHFDPPEFAQRPIDAAMAFLAETDALIVDVRGNPGGVPDTVCSLISYFLPPGTHINDIIFREGAGTRTVRFTTKPVPSNHYGHRNVYVLVDSATGSAAEEFAYDLQMQKRATVVGEKTWGGANPGMTVRLSDHFVAYMPVGMARNPVSGKNWDGTGVVADVRCSGADSLKRAELLALQELLLHAGSQNKKRLETALKEAHKNP